MTGGATAMPSRPARTDSLALPIPTVAVLIQHCGLSWPFPFEFRHIGHTPEERAHVRYDVFRDLERRGLMENYRLEDDFAIMFGTFSKPTAAIALVAMTGDSLTAVARAVTNRRFGLLIREVDDALVFDEISPTDLATPLLGLLPDAGPAPGRPITLRKPLDEEGRPTDTASLRASDSPAERAVGDLFAKPMRSKGQFLTTVRGEGGGGKVRESTVGTVAWFDTDDGRTMTTSRTSDDGRTWLTYAPADDHAIAHHLNTQLSGYL